MSGIAERLIVLRGTRSRRSFADEINIRESTLRNYEQGVTQPAADFLENICKKLRTSPAWLLLGEGPEYACEAGETQHSQETDALKKRLRELEMEKEWLERHNAALAEENRRAREVWLARDKDVEHYRRIVDGLLAHLQAITQKGDPLAGAYSPAAPSPDLTSED